MQEDGRVSGKVALITGGAGGIGGCRWTLLAGGPAGAVGDKQGTERKGRGFGNSPLHGLPIWVRAFFKINSE